MYKGEVIPQMAAFFTGQEPGNRIDSLKLLKLLYLADREFAVRYGAPISWENMISTDHGPVLVGPLNLMTGCADGPDAERWNSWLTSEAGHMVSVSEQPSREQLDHLSDANMEVLEAVWEQFGGMDKWDISEYSRNFLSEWDDPKGSFLPISEERFLGALGHGEREAMEMAQDIRLHRDWHRETTRDFVPDKQAAREEPA